MTLIVKHKSTPNQSNQNLVLQETTGVFGVLNPGGYGASQTPTGDRTVGQIVSSNFLILENTGSITYLGETLPTLIDSLYSINYTSGTAQAIANGTTQTFNLATLIGNSYVDGIYKTVYYNWFFGNVATTLDVLNGNPVIVVSSVDEFVNAKFFRDENTGEIYEIINVNTVNSEITLNTGWKGISGTVIEGAFSVSYYSEAYFANTYNINKCLHNKISKLALSNCSCKNKSTEKLYEAVMMYMSIQPNMDLGKYTKAQEIIKALTIYCNGGECNC